MCAIFSRIRVPTDDVASLEQARDEDYQSGGRECRGDELKMAKQLLDLTLLCAAEEGLFYYLFDRFSDDPGKQCGPEHQNCELLKRLSAREVRFLPRLPEEDDDCKHGPRMQHDKKQGHLR